jgi:hypothetical protein
VIRTRDLWKVSYATRLSVTLAVLSHCVSNVHVHVTQIHVQSLYLYERWAFYWYLVESDVFGTQMKVTYLVLSWKWRIWYSVESDVFGTQLKVTYLVLTWKWRIWFSVESDVFGTQLKVTYLVLSWKWRIWYSVESGVSVQSMTLTRQEAHSYPNKLLKISYSNKGGILNLDLSVNFIQWKVNWPITSNMKIQGV